MRGARYDIDTQGDSNSYGARVAVGHAHRGRDTRTSCALGAQNVELENGESETAWLAGAGVSMPMGRNQLFADLSRSVGPSSAGIVVIARPTAPALDARHDAAAGLAGRRARHTRRRRGSGLRNSRRAATPPATWACSGAGRRNSRCACPRLHLAGIRDASTDAATSSGATRLGSLSTPATPTLKERINGSSQASPEFSDYLHAIARRKALLFGIAIPIAVLAILLSLTLPDIYTSSALVEIDEPSSAQSLAGRPSAESSYADQYVQNLKGIVLTDANLRKLNKEHDLYPELEDDDPAMLKRLRRDINVKIVTTPILDPRTGREREVVDAFTLSYDNRGAGEGAEGRAMAGGAFLAEHRRQRQGRASNAAEFYAKEAERVRTHVAQLEVQARGLQARQLRPVARAHAKSTCRCMDRTESQIAQNEMQARSLRQERVFLAAQLEQQRAAGPDAGSVRQLEDQYNAHALHLRREPSGHDRAAPPDRQPEVRHQRRRRHQPALAAQLRSAPRWPRRASATARSIRTSASCSATSRRSRRASKSGERGDVEMSDGTPVGMQLRTQINAIDSQLASIDGAERRAARQAHRAREERDRGAAGRA